jgi:hypothetical protein
MNDYLKFTLEFIAIIMVYFCVDFKRPLKYRLTPLNKAWYLQWIIITIALTIIKITTLY